MELFRSIPFEKNQYAFKSYYPYLWTDDEYGNLLILRLLKANLTKDRQTNMATSSLISLRICTYLSTFELMFVLNSLQFQCNNRKLYYLY